jgi:hypothetical protein
MAGAAADAADPGAVGVENVDAPGWGDDPKGTTTIQERRR